MADPVAIVTVASRRGRETVEAEERVSGLKELFEACRSAPAGSVVRVSLRGPGGEVRLNFASFIRKG
jgi:hypothetical protein